MPQSRQAKRISRPLGTRANRTPECFDLIWDYAWVLNEQQQVLAVIGRRAPMLGSLLRKIEDLCSVQAWRKGIHDVAQLREFQAHAASIHEKMLLSSKENQAFLEKMPLVEKHSGVSSFKRLIQQLKGYKPVHSVQHVVGYCKAKRRRKGPGSLQSKGNH